VIKVKVLYSSPPRLSLTRSLSNRPRHYLTTSDFSLPPQNQERLQDASSYPNMADSDGEYVADDLSDDDIDAHVVSSHGTRSTGPARGAVGAGTRGGETGGSSRRRAAWEDIQRSWDTVVEGADGSINSTVEGLREAGKRKRSVLISVS
jgi:hypothetical protein